MPFKMPLAVQMSGPCLVMHSMTYEYLSLFEKRHVNSLMWIASFGETIPADSSRHFAVIERAEW
ncbi:hypothetical protein Pla52n_64560 [Stieleria varia]|uniref:Uncharacterized protein n=1 Tax=Stieleria varia TaxID=2528005 RepID=A0A5C6A0C0_9BACT|nr:hypothetical protein Pla52n_64560 [Stieleria varia]